MDATLPIFPMYKGNRLLDSEEYIGNIADYYRTIDAYITAWHMSNDACRKAQYFLRMQELLQEQPSIDNYSKVYWFCGDVGKNYMAEKLLAEVRQGCPWTGWLHELMFRIDDAMRR